MQPGMDGEQYGVTHPGVIRFELERAENGVAIQQAIIETMRAGNELNAALWIRWQERTEECLARGQLPPAELATAADVSRSSPSLPSQPSRIAFEATLVHRQLELARLRQLVTQRYDDCYRSLERALAAMGDTPERESRTAARSSYEQFEAARSDLCDRLDAFRRDYRDFLSERGP